MNLWRATLLACALLINSHVAFADEVCNVSDYCVERDGVKKYLKVWFKTLISGEDTVADVLKTESRFSTIPVGGNTAAILSDQLYKTGAGYVKGISCFSDAAATAGLVESATLDEVFDRAEGNYRKSIP